MTVKKVTKKKPTPKKTIEDVLFEVSQLRTEISDGLKDTAKHAVAENRIAELQMMLDERRREISNLRSEHEEASANVAREAVYNFTERLVTTLLEWRMIDLTNLESSDRVPKSYMTENGETKTWGNSKIPLIKALREIVPGIGLKQAKDLVDQWFSRTGRP